MAYNCNGGHPTQLFNDTQTASTSHNSNRLLLLDGEEERLGDFLSLTDGPRERQPHHLQQRLNAGRAILLPEGHCVSDSAA